MRMETATSSSWAKNLPNVFFGWNQELLDLDRCKRMAETLGNSLLPWLSPDFCLRVVFKNKQINNNTRLFF